MRTLLIATHNAGKLEELQLYLKDTPFNVIGMQDTSIPAEWRVDEVGQTFEGNALIKAVLTGIKSNVLTLADDSGLSIDALNGEPGVKSARYAEGTDKHRYEVVLEKMKNVPGEQRGAVFTSVLALFDPEKGSVSLAEGTCPGSITLEPKGARGFGYDPIFFADELGKTYAEATLEEKMRVDHRGKAMQKIKDILLAEYA